MQCLGTPSLGHFNGIFLSLACVKYLLKTFGNAISETLISKMSLKALALKNLCLWCEFQSHLLFIISLLLKNFLTALIVLNNQSLMFTVCKQKRFPSKSDLSFAHNFAVVGSTCIFVPFNFRRCAKST